MSDNNYLFPTPNGGFLLSTQNIPNGNMAYATAMYFVLTAKEVTALDQKLYDGLQALSPFPGLLSRSPTSLEQTQIDDYLAVACLTPFAHKMFAQGKRCLGFYDLTSPDKPSWNWAQWLWRWPHFAGHVRISAGKPLWPWHRVGWAAYIVYAAFQPRNSQDSWLQSHLMILVAKRRGYRSWIGSAAQWFWWKRKPAPSWVIISEYLDLLAHPLIDAWELYS